MLRSKVIYITGGSSGIGLSIAQHCLKNNAQVVITGRNEERLEKAKKTLSEFSPDVITECFDISDPEGLKSFIDNVYRAASVVSIAGTDAKLVSANILSVVGVNTALPDTFNIKKYGDFSWGKIITGARNGSSFVFQKDNPLSGVTTSAHVSRITELKAQY